MSTAGALSIVTVELSLRDLATFQVAVTKDGAVFDLTGCGVDFRVFNNEDDADASALFVKDTGSNGGVAITSPATLGIYTVTLAAPDAAVFTPLKLFFFRSVVTTPDGRPGTITSGYLIITP